MKHIDVRISWDENNYDGPPPVEEICADYYRDFLTVELLPEAKGEAKNEQSQTEKHLCNSCQNHIAECSGTKIVWSIDRHPDAKGADADKVLECNAYKPIPDTVDASDYNYLPEMRDGKQIGVVPVLKSQPIPCKGEDGVAIAVPAKTAEVRGEGKNLCAICGKPAREHCGFRLKNCSCRQRYEGLNAEIICNKFIASNWAANICGNCNHDKACHRDSDSQEFVNSGCVPGCSFFLNPVVAICDKYRSRNLPDDRPALCMCGHFKSCHKQGKG